MRAAPPAGATPPAEDWKHRQPHYLRGLAAPQSPPVAPLVCPGGGVARAEVALDLTGDGVSESVGYDTTGDGRVDSLDTNGDGAIDARVVRSAAVQGGRSPPTVKKARRVLSAARIKFIEHWAQAVAKYGADVERQLRSRCGPSLRACARARVCVCVCARVCACVWVRVRAGGVGYAPDIGKFE